MYNKNLERKFSNIILLITSLLASLLVAEALVRSFGHYDSDGDFYLAGPQIQPSILPIKNISEKIDRNLKFYDPDLGWGPHPIDKVRTSSPNIVISRKPKPGVLRIAIFGDSYTYGDGVTHENTWGYYLGKKLKEDGINAEVFNFGVNAYGMDQAFLRWLKIGHQFSPHIVIFGFLPENMNRNVNLIRLFYMPTSGMPLSKPRFILKGDGLELINVPTVEPQKVVSIINNPDSWPLIKHEFWLTTRHKKGKSLYKSELFSLIRYVLNQISAKTMPRQKESDLDLPSSERFQVTIRILQAFKNDVESQGGKFYIAQLPAKKDFESLSRAQGLWTSTLLKTLEKEIPVIYTGPAIFEETKDSWRTSVFKGHYTPYGHQLLGTFISDYLLQHRYEWDTQPHE